MKLNIKDIYEHGSDSGTSQTVHYIFGDIDGDPVELYYLDGGNNSEYQEDLTISSHDEKNKYLSILFALIENEGWEVLDNLRVGDSIEIDKEVKKIEKNKKKKSDLIDNIPLKTKRNIPYKGPIKF